MSRRAGTRGARQVLAASSELLGTGAMSGCVVGYDNDEERAWAAGERLRVHIPGRIREPGLQCARDSLLRADEREHGAAVPDVRAHLMHTSTTAWNTDWRTSDSTAPAITGMFEEGCSASSAPTSPR